MNGLLRFVAIEGANVPKSANEAISVIFPMCELTLKKFGNHVPMVIVFSKVGFLVADVHEFFQDDHSKDLLAAGLRTMTTDPNIKPYGIALVTECWFVTFDEQESVSDFMTIHGGAEDSPNKVDGISIMISWYDGNDVCVVSEVIRKKMDDGESVILKKSMDFKSRTAPLTGRFIGLFDTAKNGQLLN